MNESGAGPRDPLMGWQVTQADKLVHTAWYAVRMWGEKCGVIVTINHIGGVMLPEGCVTETGDYSELRISSTRNGSDPLSSVCPSQLLVRRWRAWHLLQLFTSTLNTKIHLRHITTIIPAKGEGWQKIYDFRLWNFPASKRNLQKYSSYLIEDIVLVLLKATV